MPLPEMEKEAWGHLLPVKELIETYGSPLFIVSQHALTQRFNSLKAAFENYFPSVKIAWSVKTNSLLAVGKTLKNLGAMAETSSEYDLEKAILAGFNPQTILVDGPAKSYGLLERALLLGSIINIDNLDELTLLEAISRKNNRVIQIVLRLCPNFTIGNVADRFGFAMGTDELKSVVARLVSNPNIHWIGIQFHLGTNVCDVNRYFQAAKEAALFTNEVRARHGVTLRFIDVGGGFASVSAPRNLPGTKAYCPPSFADYAQAMHQGFSFLAGGVDSCPEIILEVGRALMETSSVLATSVICTKKRGDFFRLVFLDCGLNSLGTAANYRHAISVVEPNEGPAEATVLCGPLPMIQDIVSQGMKLPPLKQGDKIVIHNTGAYNTSFWWQFGPYRPAIVFWAEERGYELIRERENFESVYGKESAPSWL